MTDIEDIGINVSNDKKIVNSLLNLENRGILISENIHYYAKKYKSIYKIKEITDYHYIDTNTITYKFLSGTLNKELCYTHILDNLLLQYYIDPNSITNEVITKQCQKSASIYKHNASKRNIYEHYLELNSKNPVNYPIIEEIRQLLITKSIRSINGIINVTIVLPGDEFSCSYKCAFCPTEPNMPKSYLSNEDAIQRAIEVGWDVVRQVHIRLDKLKEMGHTLDKIEYRIIGGTFSCFDKNITNNFIHRAIYAANIYGCESREMLSFSEETMLNASAKIHIAGIGIETRPDSLTVDELIRLRELGVTRIEMGYQTVHNSVLKYIRRGHTVEDTIRGVQLAKNFGFKIEAHIMPDLPSSTPELDRETYTQVLKTNPDLMPDYMKDYPCLDVIYTDIRKWRKDGRWKPYSDLDGGKALIDLLVYRQMITPYWVRVNRIQRDFKPSTENMDLGFSNENIKSNLGEIVTHEAIKRGIYCKCLRCTDIKGEKFTIDEIKYMTLDYVDSGAKEIFISAYVDRSNVKRILGFIRLRLPFNSNNALPELAGKTALIRELHVYGRVNKVSNNTAGTAQHIGIGKTLLKKAEAIALDNNYTKIAIISAIGVREYYRRLGYNLDGTYMTKDLHRRKVNILYIIITILIAIYLKLVVLN
jgi:elongator complex protein 3